MAGEKTGGVFVIDPDEVMAGCVAKAARGEGEPLREVKIFRDGTEAMEAISEGELPGLVFLEVFSNGPNGFAFLNEMASYEDTKVVPVVIVSELDFSGVELREYGVVGSLMKEKMTPGEIRKWL